MMRWALSLLILALAACGPPRWETLPPLSPADQPQYGGELNVGTVYVTLSALSWDPADWTWKGNHDTGNVREQLLAADLSRARSRGGPYAFTLDAYVPADALRGELAERWEWEDPLTLVVHLRKGVIWPGKEGLMAPRELDAEDVVFSYEYTNGSERRIPTYYEFLDRVEARDRHTVVYHFKTYNAEWDYRFGYGYYSAILPREAAGWDQRDWKNVTGTGPFQLDRYLQGSVQSFAKSPGYWDRERIGDKEFAIPFIDRVTYRIIKDEATFITGIRTGKLDILESIRWTMAKHLKESTPELQWNRFLAPQGTLIALRTDQPPLNDVRVRRALSMAINRDEMIKFIAEDQAERMAFPQHPDFGPYYKPLEQLSDSVQATFRHDPEEAKRLLTESGLPNGFDLKIQVCSCNPGHMDTAPLIADYWSRIGVRTALQPMEYASFLSAMTTRTHGPAYLFDTGVTTPTSSLRKNYDTGQLWNAAMFSDPAIDRRLDEMLEIRDEAERIEVVRQLSEDLLDQTAYVVLPTPYLYTAWWPWVRNYGGELRAGAVRPGPIYARVWIDHDLRKRMGFE